jgi:hypothetical protein
MYCAFLVLLQCSAMDTIKARSRSAARDSQPAVTCLFATMSSALSPLHGKDGIYRVVIHGNSGTGKTTLSNKLAEILQIPVIHLDEVHWRPGWIEAPDEEMIKELALQIDKSVQTDSGWIVDGNYERCTNRIMDFAATDIICLLKESACFNHVELSLMSPRAGPSFLQVLPSHFNPHVSETFGTRGYMCTRLQGILDRMLLLH